MTLLPSISRNTSAKAQRHSKPIVFCFSHLRWKFVYQRPQHLMNRCQGRATVFFMEEPLLLHGQIPELSVEADSSGVRILTPLLPTGLDAKGMVDAQRALLDQFLLENGIKNFAAWYYTPMALLFSSHLRPEVVVYDCMDELSAFADAPPQLAEQERRLFARANVIFAGGRSLYEVKRNQHHNVHLFPSTIDRAHFAAGRLPLADPEDQSLIPHPRVGFFGVLDERLDQVLLKQVAARQPWCHFVLVGPVAKIRQEDLPQADNIHYLGQKTYAELPSYLANWDVAMLPFAQNASTRFISPTKTPEYLAAGKPVVSTPIRDVVDPYGILGLAKIAGTPDEFCTAIEQSLLETDERWLESVDKFLRRISWDHTFDGMWKELMRARPVIEADEVNHERHAWTGERPFLTT